MQAIFSGGSRGIDSDDSIVAPPLGAHTSGSTYSNPYIIGFRRRLNTISPQSMSTTSASGHHYVIWTIIGITGATEYKTSHILSAAIHQLTYQDIAVVAPSATTRFLDYQLRTGKLRNIYRAFRIKSAQRRLFTATRVATTLEHRVLILNAIVLLGILFTAPVFELPE